MSEKFEGKTADELDELGLITNYDDYSKYNCYHANVRTKYLSSEQLFKLRNDLDNKYWLNTGALWRLIKQHPLFFTKLIPEQLIKRPKKVFAYLKGL